VLLSRQQGYKRTTSPSCFRSITSMNHHTLADTILTTIVVLPIGLICSIGAICSLITMWTARNEKKDLLEWIIFLGMFLGGAFFLALLGFKAIKETVDFFSR
jgi:hypothetical protein